MKSNHILAALRGTFVFFGLLILCGGTVAGQTTKVTAGPAWQHVMVEVAPDQWADLYYAVGESVEGLATQIEISTLRREVLVQVRPCQECTLQEVSLTLLAQPAVGDSADVVLTVGPADRSFSATSQRVPLAALRVDLTIRWTAGGGLASDGGFAWVGQQKVRPEKFFSRRHLLVAAGVSRGIYHRPDHLYIQADWMWELVRKGRFAADAGFGLRFGITHPGPGPGAPRQWVTYPYAVSRLGWRLGRAHVGTRLTMGGMWVENDGLQTVTTASLMVGWQIGR